jgi:hypothetical protein
MVRVAMTTVAISLVLLACAPSEGAQGEGIASQSGACDVLRAQISDDPEVAAENDFKNGRVAYKAVRSYTLLVPGMEQRGLNDIRIAEIRGTSDSSCIVANRDAYRYAEVYNHRMKVLAGAR